MLRTNKIALVSHCVLNQNSVVHPLARANGPLIDVIRPLMDHNIALIQLPCPETLHLGLSRLPMDYDEYNTPEYKALCHKLSVDQMAYIEKLVSGGAEIIALIGIAESPSCSQTGQNGHFMEALHKLLPQNILRIDVGAEIPALSADDIELLLKKM